MNHNLEEFPPRAMTGYKNYFEGHGEFCASASTWYNQASSSSPIYPWNAFNKGALGFSTGNGYANNWEASSADYSSSTGLYTGLINTAGISGDWVQLELPYAIKLDYMELMPMYYNDGTHPNIGPARSPQDGHIMASNDGINWISIYNWTGRTDFKTLEYTRFKVPGTVTKVYKYFRIVWTRTNYTAPSGGSYSTYAAAGELKFFGTREQGQSVLHDGALTLTKNLNVPRIGPALDADDTPRRDRLMVEYNTSTNPTSEGAVRDTSGRGNDGVLSSSGTYDAVHKSFETFSSGGIKTMTTNNLLESNGKHSFSAWIRFDSPSTWEGVYGISPNTAFTGNNDVSVLIGTNLFRIETRTSGPYWSDRNYTFVTGKWVHMVVVYDGFGGLNGFDIYMDTVKLAQGSLTNGTAALNLPANLSVHFGQGSENSPTAGPTYVLDGGMSSIKFYDTALTSEEIEALYNMGRCDEGHHVVNFTEDSGRDRLRGWGDPEGGFGCA